MSHIQSAVDLISISVVSELDGKRYRIVIKEANFNKLKVGDIKRNLQSVSGLSPEDQEISVDGAVLADAWTAADFGLHPFSQLTLKKRGSTDNNNGADQIDTDRPVSPKKESAPTPRENPKTLEKISSSDRLSNHSSSSFTPSISSPSILLPRSLSSQSQLHSIMKPQPQKYSSAPPLPPPAASQTAQYDGMQPTTMRDVSNRSGVQGDEQYEQSESITMNDHLRLLSETVLLWKTRLNNETRKWIDEKRALLKTSNQDRQKLLAENHKLRALLGDEDLQPQDKQNADLSLVEERNMLQEQLTVCQAQCKKLGEQKNEFSRKIAEERELVKHERMRFDEEKKHLIASFIDDKNKLLKSFAQEREEWLENLRKKILATHSDNEASSSPSSEEVGLRKAEWDMEKQQLLNNWSEETDALVLIYDAEKLRWEKERDEIVAHYDELQLSSMEQYHTSVTTYEEQVSKLRQNILQYRQKEDSLHSRIAQLRLIADERALIAQAAQRSVDELKEVVRKAAHGSSELAQAVISSTTQKNIEVQKMEKFKLENSHLRSRLKEESMLRNLLNDKLDDILGRVRVVCRLRPLLSSEISNHNNPSIVNGEAVVDCVNSTKVVVKSGLVSLAAEKSFDFHSVLGPTTTQNQLYEEVLPFVQSFCDGHNVLIMAYGHTGSGKTYTMFGNMDSNSSSSSSRSGILHRSIDQIFAVLSRNSVGVNNSNNGLPPTHEWFLDCMMLEVYTGDIYDLVKDSTAFEAEKDFRWLTAHRISFRSPQDAHTHLTQRTAKRRQVAGTALDPRPSKSHEVVVLQLRSHSPEFDDVNVINVFSELSGGRLVLVDLAGSESVSQPEIDAIDEPLQQSTSNDLNSIKDIITSLSHSGTREPTSRLSSLLRDCLDSEEKCKVLVVGTVSPSSVDLPETLKTLNFVSSLKK